MSLSHNISVTYIFHKHNYNILSYSISQFNENIRPFAQIIKLEFIYSFIILFTTGFKPALLVFCLPNLHTLIIHQCCVKLEIISPKILTLYIPHPDPDSFLVFEQIKAS